jgi:aminopeptidase YwaD
MSTENYEYNFIKSIIDAVGPRLACSEEEKKASQMQAKITGTKANIEQFICHPKASIGFIPVLGYLLLVLVLLYFWIPLVTLIILGFFLVYAIIQIFLYKGWLDFLTPRGQSQNVFTVVEPKEGKADFTIILSAHIDSSWHWKIAVKNPTSLRPKITMGVIGAFVFLLFNLLKVIEDYTIFDIGIPWLYYLILIFVPSWFFISQFLTWNKKQASPGAMDDLAGIAVGFSVMRYIKKHPDQAPKNCRVILLTTGSEEAGTKGSRAFIQKHKDDLLKGNVWVINIDSISDYNYFQVIDGDTWLGSKNDPDLCQLAEEAYKELNVRYDVIENPVGATDAASFSLNGIRAVTMSAQDPGPANNYHTCLDDLEHMDFRAVDQMNQVVLRLIQKVEKFVHTSK